MTTNHEYNTPEPGTPDWHIPLNENFEMVDTGVTVRDAEANMSSYSPKAGAKFEATDTGRVFFGDGAAWVYKKYSGIFDVEPTNPREGDILLQF